MDQPAPSAPEPESRPPAATGPPQLKIELGGAGWVLLVAGLLGLYLLLHLTWPLLTGQVQPQRLNQTPEELGFNLSNCSIPRERIVAAAPADSIPPLVMPKTVAGQDAAALTREYRRKYHHKFVVSGDRVVGVSINGESRAYQLKILQWHEVVNDVVGGVPIAVTYSPLTDSVAVYDRRVDGEVVALAASGLLYNSNSLLFEKNMASTVCFDSYGPLDGERWYSNLGCKQCHSLDGSAGTGPSFKNLYGNHVRLSDGSTALADADYIRESILDPGAKRVHGFEAEMPSFQGRLEDKSIAKIVEWMKSLSDGAPADEQERFEREVAGFDQQRAEELAKQQAADYLAVPADWSPRGASLWSQLGRGALSGQYKRSDTYLAPLPCELTHWGDWLARHPDTTLLSDQTGHDREYTKNAYGAYYDRMKLRFPVAPAPSGTPAEQFSRWIAVRRADGQWRAYSYAQLQRQPQQDGLRFVYEPFGAGLEPDSVRLAEPEGLPCVYGLQFALEASGYLERPELPGR